MTDEIEDIRARKREELASESSSTPAPGEPVHIEDAAHFEEFTTEHDVVLVDFYADWCGPCQMLEPVVADVAEETDAAVAKVDVDAHQQLAAQYGVRGVPTVVVLADGETAEQVVGVREKAHYVSLIERHS